MEKKTQVRQGMMTWKNLPVGTNPSPLKFPHFPTKQQAVVWRNWEMVPVQNIARILRTNEKNILALAAGMGLNVPPKVNPLCLQRSYVTIIKKNWHLLPYPQLLDLLGWTSERMLFVLKEEDFLWRKLGGHKPGAELVLYEPLTAQQEEKTELIRKIMKNHFSSPTRKNVFLFDFIKQFREPAGKTRNKSGLKQKGAGLRLIYPYYTLYGDTLLDPEFIPPPEGLLAEYSRLGINGIWIHAMLYKLVPLKKISGLSKEHEKRIRNLRILARRAEEYGIGVYLYFNEPRAMPAQFFEKYPDWKGVEEKKDFYSLFALCTSCSGVCEYLKEGTAEIFRQVPELSGVFTISMSENLTHCASHAQWKECPKCGSRNPWEIVAQVNNLIEEGVHSVKSNARVIAWTWGWHCRGMNIKKTIELLSPRIELMCTSEEAMTASMDGLEIMVYDYNIACIGPGKRAKDNWKTASEKGMKTLAKVQVNTTWQCGQTPYLPVLDIIGKHTMNLRNSGVDGLMLSWALGGYPSFNIDMVLEIFRSSEKNYSKIIDGFLTRRFGGKAAPYIKKGCAKFSAGLKEFPPLYTIMYYAPQNQGPANLLYEKPTGYKATMTVFPYDDLDGWRNIYSEDAFREAFYRLNVKWKKGIELLERAEKLVNAKKHLDFSSLLRMAICAYLHFRSAYLQIDFLRKRKLTRDDIFTILSPKQQMKTINEILALLDEEITLAKKLYSLMMEDSTIGFDATHQYFYTPQDLKEKVLNCEYLKKKYIEKMGMTKPMYTIVGKKPNYFSG